MENYKKVGFLELSLTTFFTLILGIGIGGVMFCASTIFVETVKLGMNFRESVSIFEFQLSNMALRYLEWQDDTRSINFYETLTENRQ